MKVRMPDQLYCIEYHSLPGGEAVVTSIGVEDFHPEVKEYSGWRTTPEVVRAVFLTLQRWERGGRLLPYLWDGGDVVALSYVGAEGPTWAGGKPCVRLGEVRDEEELVADLRSIQTAAADFAAAVVESLRALIEEEGAAFRVVDWKTAVALRTGRHAVVDALEAGYDGRLPGGSVPLPFEIAKDWKEPLE
jgi:hypothetical protein